MFAGDGLYLRSLCLGLSDSKDFQHHGVGRVASGFLVLAFSQIQTLETKASINKGIDAFHSPTDLYPSRRVNSYLAGDAG